MNLSFFTHSANKSYRLISGLSLVMALLISSTVLLSYCFHWAHIALQELVIYCHSFLLSLMMGYTVMHDEHVRVDIFYQNFSARNKALVNLIGTTMLLIPLCLALFYYASSYVFMSWRLLESSQEPNGLPWLYVQKTTLFILPSLLLVHALIELYRNVQRFVSATTCTATQARH